MQLHDNSPAVVFGARGGVGKALVQELERDGPVLALSRQTKPAVDITDEQSVALAAAAVLHAIGPPRLVIVATGFLHAPNISPEKTWRDLDIGHMQQAFAVNAMGPALVMKHFLPLLPRKGRSVFAAISARVGSIGDNRLGGWYSYRASKAALNQYLHTAAIELKRRAPEAICVAIHPGTVETALSAPFAKVGLKPQSPERAAQRILATLNTLDEDASGGFFDHNGREIPW